MKWSKETKAFIDAVTNCLKDMNFYENVDDSIFMMLGDSVQLYLDASKDVDKNGIVMDCPDGVKRQNPAYKIMNSERVNILSYLKECGVTGRGRRMMKVKLPDTVEKSPLMQFLEMNV